jgi:hypothetical protein
MIFLLGMGLGLISTGLRMGRGRGLGSGGWPRLGRFLFLVGARKCCGILGRLFGGVGFIGRSE